jgi:hypothetical protein
VSSLYRLLRASLVVSAMLGQQSPPTSNSIQVFPVVSPQIFPTLSYGPSAWSLLRLTNPAASPKSVKVSVYRSNGELLPIDSLYTLKPGEMVDIRIDGQQVSYYESCWARVEDVSIRKSKPSLQVSAREEQVTGNTLEDHPQTIARSSPAGRWLVSAVAVGDRSAFFLNVSDKPTLLNVCSADTAWRPSCSRNGSGTHVAVNPRQSVVLKFRNLRQPYLLVESSVRVNAIFGLLRLEPGTRRVFSTESSVNFDELTER